MPYKNILDTPIEEDKKPSSIPPETLYYLFGTACCLIVLYFLESYFSPYEEIKPYPDYNRSNQLACFISAGSFIIPISTFIYTQIFNWFNAKKIIIFDIEKESDLGSILLVFFLFLWLGLILKVSFLGDWVNYTTQYYTDLIIILGINYFFLRIFTMLSDEE